MKKITTTLVMFAMLIISMFTFVACDEPNRTIADVQEKYAEMVAKYSDGNSNSMFQKNTIKVTYGKTSIKPDIDSNPSTNTEKRLYALNFYDVLLEGIFAYYECYSENLYSVSFDVPQNDVNVLYSRLLDLEKRLKSFNNFKKDFEGELDEFDEETPPANTITIFTYEYNKLVQSAINFNEKFIQIHKDYFYGEEEPDINALNRLFQEAKFYISKYVFLENFKSLNNVKGQNGVCDLEALVTQDKLNSNPYVLLKSLDINDASLNLGDQNVFDSNLSNLIYFRNCFAQEFKIYINIFNKFDMLEYSICKLDDDYESKLVSFSASLNSTEESQYQFIENFRTNIVNSYVNALLKFIES